MDRAELIDVLRATALFSGFSEEELEMVPKVGRPGHHDEGAVIVAPDGPEPRTMWIVIEGEVAVQTEGTVLATLGPGQYFGEMALLVPDLPREVEVVASVATETFELQQRQLLGLCASSPEIALGVMGELARRLHETTGVLRQVMAESPEAHAVAERLGVSFTDRGHEAVRVIDQPERQA
jgi:CRP-like cAMP-binding protein